MVGGRRPAEETPYEKADRERPLSPRPVQYFGGCGVGGFLRGKGLAGGAEVSDAGSCRLYRGR
jgi:hypothetical protein